MLQLRTTLLLLAVTLASVEPLTAQGRRDRGEGSRPTGPLEVHEPPQEAGIAWFGTWEEALAEAKRTGRPILFQSAAPQCQSVPGVW